MTEQTGQSGRGGGSDVDAGAAPDAERTQALPVEGASARTAPLDAEPRPTVAGVAPTRADGSRGPAVEEPPAAARTAGGEADEPGRRTGGPGSTRLDEGDGRRSQAETDEPARTGPPRTTAARPAPRSGGSAGRSTGTPGRQRRARLRLRAIDPWSVFVLALLVSLFLAVVLVVAVVALYAVLQAAGVPDSINALYAEVTRAPGGGEPEPLLSAGRALTTAGVLAVVNVVLVTALSTLSAVLYNLCASFTGGVEVTLAEHDS